MKLSERIEEWIKAKYVKKNVEFTPFDNILVKFWIKVFPKLVLIPVLFYVMKWFLIDYVLATKGFEIAVMYIAIILVLRPMIVDVFKNMIELRR